MDAILLLGFGEKLDVRESLKMSVLSPEGSIVSKRDGIDEGVGERQLIFDEQIGGLCGDHWVNVDHDCGEHSISNGLRIICTALG